MNFLFEMLLCICFGFGCVAVSQETGPDNEKQIYYYKLWDARVKANFRHTDFSSYIYFYLDQGKTPQYLTKVQWIEMGYPTKDQIHLAVQKACKKIQIPTSAIVMEYPYSKDY